MPYGSPPGLRTFATDNVAGPSDAAVDLFGSRNLAVGIGAGTDVGDASVPRAVDDSVFLGDDAGRNSQVGSLVVIGSGAGNAGFPAGSQVDGSVVIGHRALQSLVNARSDAVTDQGGLIVIGQDAMRNVAGVTGATGTSGVIAIGNSVMRDTDDPRETVMIGHYAGLRYSDRPDFTTALGHRAVGGISGAIAASGQNNTGIGHQALGAVTTGLDNCATGRGTLQGTTSGQRNAAFGTLAMSNNSTGSENAILGYGAGGNGAHSFNVVVGANSGAGLAGGDDFNTIVGYANATVSTIGDANIIIGALAATQNIPTANNRFYVELAATACLHGDLVDGNLNIGPAQTNRAWGAGTAVLKIQDGTAPSANPVAGGYLYHTNAVGLNFRGAAGTITNIAPP